MSVIQGGWVPGCHLYREVGCLDVTATWWLADWKPLILGGWVSGCHWYREVGCLDVTGKGRLGAWISLIQ